ncbi:putative major facilitator superfamily transporter [Rosellinia necatrix]|uniref:Putative major facilitator superfamily transporter n=1 Tax=Rosellinia necatrix TaxID=77044 RepID=A0A1S8A4Q5_ROSNE|nr:putative major facilitator superfamily transporter [Rosellinia necatrix]
MDASMFQALVQVESNSLPRAPQRAVSRTYPAVPQRDESIELRPLTRSSAAPTPSGPSTPQEERDVEMTAAGTPASVLDAAAEPANAFEVLPNLTDQPMNKFRYLACCTQNVIAGLTDSAPGALIPYIEK